MRRVIIICEGETEQDFCKTILYHHFIGLGLHIQPPLIKKTRGGIVKWDVLKKQIEGHLKEDSNAYVTTLIDYYGLYEKYQFPQWELAHTLVDKEAMMDSLEQGMRIDINNNRFIPYMQLHEFEGLLFNDVNIFYQVIPKYELVGMQELNKTFSDYSNPEMINNNRQTSPSHRLQRIIKGYNKVVYGNIIAEAIGLLRIRQKCPRFNNWITNLENLRANETTIR